MKLLITSLFLVLCSLVYSQGNLQFNQVKRFSNQSVNIATQAWISVGSITVPAGTVWKIESSSVTFSGTNCAFMLAVDGQTIFTGLNTNGGYTMNSIAPIWLPEGTYPVTVYHNYPGVLPVDKIKISAIEFNIIP
jgi:hypothetical protein